MVSKLSEAQRKRVRAARMLQKGNPVAQVALAVGVARQTVYTWKRVLDESGVDGLRAMVDVGRPGQLSAADFKWLDLALRQGAQAHGFGTELWTLKRVGVLIKRQFGIKFSDVHVWRLLGSMGFSSQKPERRAIERNEDAVRTWKTKTLPSLKKSDPGAKSHRLHRRIGIERAAHTGTYVGTHRSDAGCSVPFQLEACLGHRRTDPDELPVSVPRWLDQKSADRRISQGAQATSEAQASDHLGWSSGASQSTCTRLFGLDQRCGSGRVSAALRAGLQSGRVPVGLAQAPCLGELLPRHLARPQGYRQKQAQERSAPTVDYRCVLETG